MPDEQPSELVVAVPPPATLGVSLWGSGDADDVTILFECDLSDKVVSASIYAASCFPGEELNGFDLCSEPGIERAQVVI
jgi:hypothetical protein